MDPGFILEALGSPCPLLTLFPFSGTLQDVLSKAQKVIWIISPEYSCMRGGSLMEAPEPLPTAANATGNRRWAGGGVGC